jgi:transcriptional regulator with XRE-family HTH domain
VKKTLNDYLSKLPAVRKEKVKKRAAQLIGEELTLCDLRKARQQSQQKIAKVFGIKRVEVLEIERRTDLYISLLRHYIEAMGGKFEIMVTFPDSPPVRISQFEDLDLRL